MNIEIANRLVNLRKSNNLSQEALAQKLGISRQAVSKWERAEASPDTDNLILLARLYGVSLDELLKTDDEIPRPYEEERNMEEEEGRSGEEENPEYVDVSFRGIHVKNQNEEVHVGWDGIHVDDKKKGDNVHIDKQGVYVNGEKYDKKWFFHHAHFPMTMIITFAYIVIGCAYRAWHPGWLLFLLVPIWYSLVEAIERRNAHCFAYPVLATLVYLCLGFFGSAWHPAWVVYLTVPLYYALVSYFQDLAHRKKKDDDSVYDASEGTGETDEEQ